jgi:CheY-like chemotaxis protein
MARFLVADNDAAAAKALHRLLTEDGHEVNTVRTGRDALGALSSAPFDAVLADLELRGGNGYQVARAARTHHPSACVFITTVRSGLVVVPDACHVFGKPLQYGALAQMVSSCRGSHQLGRCLVRTIAGD